MRAAIRLQRTLGAEQAGTGGRRQGQRDVLGVQAEERLADFKKRNAGT